MTKQLKIRCIVYIVGVIVYVAAVTVSAETALDARVKFGWFLAAYLIIGFESFRRFSDSLMQKKFMTEYTLIILATIGALGIERYAEGVFVMLLFNLGMLFSIIKPGERIPADAIITYGISDVDAKALTGEAMPRSVGAGDKIYSGCINLSAVVEAMVVGVYEDSAVTRIMKMVEDAQEKKAGSEDFIGRFSKVYTPFVLALAAGIMCYPPLSFSYGNWDTWIYRGLIFLVVACPCGLILSIPLAFLGGIAASARQGIVVKGRNYLEDLSKADTFIFDKTGTLTEGVFRVTDVRAFSMTREELLRIAAHVEGHSNHPIAQSLMTEYRRQVDKRKVYRMKEMPGFGVSAMFEGAQVLVGNKKLMEWQNIVCADVNQAGTVLYVAVEGRYAGYIVIEDTVKEDTKDTLRYLKDKCNAVLVMLTGDTEKASIPVARELGMDYAYMNLMPEDKLEHVEDFLGIQGAMERLVCVGDGINDAPVLARADVGIAMGALGSAAAIEAADVILLEDELSGIVDAVKIARETVRVVSHNISFALFIKALVLVLAIIGYFSMWEAIFAEVGVMFIALMSSAGVARYTV